MSKIVETERLDKELGLFDVYAVSTGAMFSSGFFLLPGLAAALTGPSVAFAYLVAGLLILPAMFSVGELASAMPRAGGAYYFLDRALGPLVGTVGGLGTWLALILKSSFALVGMGAYLALYVDVPIKPLAAALTILFAIINVVGAKETSGLQKILVTALLVIMGLFLVAGMWEVGSRGFVATTADRFTPFFAFGATGFFATVGFVFVSYAGLTKVASVAEEVRNPDRNIPLGMMLAVATASVVYSMGVYIIVAVLPPSELRSDLTPVATAGKELLPWLPHGAALALIVVAAVAAFASTGNAGILSASRYPLAMARDRLLPGWFGALGRFRTPARSILATAGVMIVAIYVLDVEGIAKLASSFQLLLFSMLCLAVIVMRESGIDGYDPGYRSPFYPWMQIVGIFTPFWLIAMMGPMAIVFSLLLVTATVSWYFRYARPRIERTGAIFHTFARLGVQRHSGLDMELRAIVREKGLREEDRFDEVAARAPVLEFPEKISFDALVDEAVVPLARLTGQPQKALAEGFRSQMRAGFMPIANGGAIPHLRVPGLARPVLILARCQQGVVGVPGRGDASAEALAGLRAVFFLVSLEEEPGQHLRLLGHLATHIDDATFLPDWVAAPEANALRATLLREERSLTLRVASDSPTAAWVGRKLRDIALPEQALVALVRRGRHGIIPNGETVLRQGDNLTVIGDPAAIRALAGRFGTTGIPMPEQGPN